MVEVVVMIVDVIGIIIIVVMVLVLLGSADLKDFHEFLFGHVKVFETFGAAVVHVSGHFSGISHTFDAETCECG